LAQEFLGWNVKVSKLLMGIGSGTYPESSGEFILGNMLYKQSRNTKSPIIIFDVGANEGQFSEVILKELHGCEYRIHAFEPNSVAIRKFEEKFGNNRNFIFNNFGLSNKTGKANLFLDKPNSVRASMFEQNLNHLDVSFDYKERVSLDTLDNYCQQKKIDFIDLLKLDVEGSELNILKGSNLTLMNGRIKIISFEFGECYIGSRTYFKDVYHFLKTYGMKELFRITPSGYLYSIKKYSEEYEQFFPTNYLAIMK
jgi:FkbM family methyltransferase